MAAVDYFLKLDGVDGESADDKHKGEIDVLSWSWGVQNVGTMGMGGGGGSGKVSVGDIHFVKKADKSSPKLLLHSCSGKHISTGKLVCRKAGETPLEYLTITFSDVLISSYQTSGGGHGDPVPTESISLNLGKFEVEYKEQTAKGGSGGSVKTNWDVKANKGS